MIDPDQLERHVQVAAAATGVAAATPEQWADIIADLRAGARAQAALINIGSQARLAVKP